MFAYWCWRDYDPFGWGNEGETFVLEDRSWEDTLLAEFDKTC